MTKLINTCSSALAAMALLASAAFVKAKESGVRRRSNKATTDPEASKLETEGRASEHFGNQWVVPEIPFTMSPPAGIIGGEPLPPDVYPFLISIGRNIDSGWRHSCGATLISANVVLCVAQCMLAGDGSFAPLDFMDFYRYSMSDDTGVVRINICQSENGCPDNEAYVITHPDFIGPDMPGPFIDNDFALLFLPEPFDDIVPVMLNKEEDIPTSNGEDLEAIGWGDTDPDPDVVVYPDLPHTVILQYVDNPTCEQVYEDNITPNTLCAFADDKATCAGDAGGPLLHGTVQVGMPSFGVQACTGYPSVFARVSAGYDWIIATVCDETNNEDALCDGYSVLPTPYPTPSPVTPSPTTPSPTTPSPTPMPTPMPTSMPIPTKTMEPTKSPGGITSKSSKKGTASKSGKSSKSNKSGKADHQTLAEYGRTDSRDGEMSMSLSMATIMFV